MPDKQHKRGGGCPGEEPWQVQAQGRSSSSTWGTGPSPRALTWPDRSRCCTAGTAGPPSVRPPVRPHGSAAAVITACTGALKLPRKGTHANCKAARNGAHTGRRVLSPCASCQSLCWTLNGCHSRRRTFWHVPCKQQRDLLCRVRGPGSWRAPGLWQRRGMRPAARPPERPPDASPKPPAAPCASSLHTPTAGPIANTTSAVGCMLNSRKVQ